MTVASLPCPGYLTSSTASFTAARTPGLDPSYASVDQNFDLG